MAREYLFKAKRKDDGEWVYGLPKYDDSGAIYYFEVIKEWARIYRIVPETICEYTGKTDKNGTKIFEGDIIRYESGFGVVTWAENHCAFMCVEEKGEYWEWFDNIYMPFVEVIGNKFDNPELLEVQDD